MVEKITSARKLIHCSHRGGPPPTRVFSFRSAPQSTNGATEGAPSQSPRLHLITRASRNPSPVNGKAGRVSAHLLSPPRCGHRQVSPSETGGRSGTHKRQSCGEGQSAPRPARPAPDGRARPLPALRGCLPAEAHSGPQAHRPAGLRLAAAPAASSARMSPISASPRGGLADLQASCAR